MFVMRWMGVLVVLMGCQEKKAVPAVKAVPPDAAAAVAVAPPDAAVEEVLPHQTFTLDSKVLAETRRINIYTPPGYADGTTRYPVLYMPDGGVAEDFPHVIKTVDTAIRAGEMRAVIVVGIENTERRRDMAPPTELEEEKKMAPLAGGSTRFRAFFRDELIPLIEQRVRGNGETGIMGESLAGLFVVEIFFAEPEMFDVYIAISPSVHWNNQAVLADAAAKLRSRPKLAATFWFTTAGDDNIDGEKDRLADILRANAPASLKWFYEPTPTEKHATIYRAVSPMVLRKLYPAAR